MQDKESQWQAKFEEIEQEITELNESHRQELKNEKERLETRLREQLRSTLKVEVTEELEKFYQE